MKDSHSTLSDIPVVLRAVEENQEAVSPPPSRPRRWPHATVAAISSVAVLSGCGTVNYSSDPRATDAMSPSESCAPDRVMPLPNAVTVANVVDQRDGDIYACNYLADARIPYDKPTPLFSVKNEVYDSNNFQSSGSFGGWMLIGTIAGSGLGGGKIDGKNSASSETERKRVSLIKFKDDDGNLQTALIDYEKVRVHPCDDNSCTPSFTINVPQTPLWKRWDGTVDTGPDQAPDHSSIWRAHGDITTGESLYGANADESARKTVVDSISRPNKSGHSGPGTAGDIISGLATSIVVTLPPKDIQ